MTIVSLSEKFNQIDTDKIIQESLVETTPQFETSQKDQLYHGKTKTGAPIRPRYRNPKYAAGKAAINPLPGLGVPDLKLTGDFYSGIDVEVGNDVFDIISEDEKGPALENKYPNIFGLGTTYKSDYLTKGLGPVVRRKITDFTGLKFS
jgi:hypothetical protein